MGHKGRKNIFSAWCSIKKKIIILFPRCCHFLEWFEVCRPRRKHASIFILYFRPDPSTSPPIFLFLLTKKILIQISKISFFYKKRKLKGSKCFFNLQSFRHLHFFATNKIAEVQHTHICQILHPNSGISIFTSNYWCNWHWWYQYWYK